MNEDSMKKVNSQVPEITDDDILAIASNPDTCPVWPWWLKGDVTAEEVRALTLRFARALLKRFAASPAPDHIPNAAKLVEAADSLSRLLEHKIPGHFLKRVEPQLSDFIDEITNYSRKQEEAER